MYQPALFALDFPCDQRLQPKLRHSCDLKLYAFHAADPHNAHAYLLKEGNTEIEATS